MLLLTLRKKIVVGVLAALIVAQLFAYFSIKAFYSYTNGSEKLNPKYIILQLLGTSDKIEHLPSASASISTTASASASASHTSPNTAIEAVKSSATFKAASPHYQRLLEKYLDDFPTKFTFDERCQLYFNDLYHANSSWSAADINSMKHDAGVFNADEYISQRIGDFERSKKEKQKEDGNNQDEDVTATEEEMEKIKQDFNYVRESTEFVENLMVDTMTHLRVFDQCYLRSQNHSVDFGKLTKDLRNKVYGFSAFIDEKNGHDKREADKVAVKDTAKEKSNKNVFDGYTAMCADTEPRLFPWMSKKLPEFKKWDGSIHDGIPDMAKYNKEKDIQPLAKSYKTSSAQNNNNNCFIQSLKQSINGRGIVLSASDLQVNDMIALLRILRALNNKLPIQVVHKGDLTEKTVAKLVSIARDPKDDFIESLYGNYSSVHGSIHPLYPKQEIWFVNVTDCISDNYKHRFESYNNKYLALIFNSFDEMLLMDTDAVPFVNPDFFFQSPAYTTTQTWFFKDRLNNAMNVPQDVHLFKKLLPSTIDNLFFKIATPTAHTLDLRFFKLNYKHLMESGILTLGRNAHFAGMLAAVQLSFWEPLSSKTWGDKETYWLGLSMMGDESYYFNKHGAGAIANDNSSISANDRKTKFSISACSVQPAHLSSDDNQTLLWINSGFKKCKKESWGADILLSKYRNMFGEDNQDALRKYYGSALHIYGVLVPPALEEIDERTLRKGWKMENECFGYKYCALTKFYDGDNGKPEAGQWTQFNETMQMVYDYYGQIWIEGYNYNDQHYKQEEEKHKEEEEER